jgi:hypothetical protein
VLGKPLLLSFDKSAFYAVMETGNLKDIDAQLSLVRESIITEKNAYEGALLMKKSGIVTKTNEKLSLFKSGRSKLESSILKDNSNIEYRFLRLIIQEHAPKVVKYRNEIKEDSNLIRTHFKNLSPLLQQLINEYSEKSTALKIAQP